MLKSPVDRMLRRYGATFTLQRLSKPAGPNAWTAGGAPVPTFYPCRARPRGYDPRKVQGTAAESGSLIVIDAATLAVAPEKGDRIAPGKITAPGPAKWAQVVSVDGCTEAGAVRVWRLQVSE